MDELYKTWMVLPLATQKLITNIAEKILELQKPKTPPKITLVRVKHNGKQRSYNFEGQQMQDISDVAAFFFEKDHSIREVYERLISLQFSGITHISIFKESKEVKIHESYKVDIHIELVKPF
jgi:hypothetical protein